MVWLLLAFGSFGQTTDDIHYLNDPTVGWLWDWQDADRGCTEYVPREGDMVFTSSIAPSQTNFYLAGRTNHPFHSGIIVRRRDGTLAVLETGGGGAHETTLMPVDDRFYRHLQRYAGSVCWVRRIARPLTPAESQRLTHFAEQQLGKPFVSNCRFLIMLIPGRPAPQSHPGQRKWFCSELVLMAAIEAGLVRTDISPGSTVPTDLFHNRRVNLSPLWLPPQEWSAGPYLPSRRPALAPAAPE